MTTYDKIDDMLERMGRELGADFRAALFTKASGIGPYVMIMRRPDKKYPTVWAEAHGNTLNEALEVAIDKAFKKLAIEG